jgi:alanine racemase
MASPDQDLEFVIIDIMGFTLTHPVGLALPQSYVLTFEEFRSIDVDDVYEFTYTDKANANPDTKLHFMLVKQVQRCIHYTHYKETKNDAQSNNPTLWSKSEYTTWCRNGYATYLASLAPATATPLLPVTSMTAAYVSPAQKDDDAALISWNRKP